MRLTLLFSLALAGRAIADPSFTPIDKVVNDAISRGELPGAVVLILQKDQAVFQRAYGNRNLEPSRAAMTDDTIFDLASLTKPVATATSVFLLIEQGKLKLDDPVAKHWPEFGVNGKDQVTIEHCLVHTSGLTADNALADYDGGKLQALERIAALKLEAAPGIRFRYSDVGYIVLGELVERLGRLPLDAFFDRHIARPLKLTDTSFLTPKAREVNAGRFASRVAPTTKEPGYWMIGTVHDPRARAMSGVAGHAGLFATAADLARFARMLLHEGELDGIRILKPESVRKMLEPVAVPGGWRNRGWDVDTSFSTIRGAEFPKGKSFGHTGFTGTGIWIDPTTQTAVIFLSNRVHPNGKGNVTKLRGQVSTLAAQALKGDTGKPRREGTLCGIDVLVAEKFASLKGRKVGLVTNHTGRDREGRATIDLLHGALEVKLVALFSPEHGIRGAVDAKVADATDRQTGLPIYSLYGKRLKPTADTLEGIDTLVYDIQDIGCRFYTYISTLGNVMEAAAEHKLKLVVLDRPNPIGGLAVAGPVLDAGRESFVAWHRLPIRHGLTIGEMAMLFNAERKINVDLTVVRMEGWRRHWFYDRTGMTWVNPSPNMRSLTQALLYPGIGLLETTNVSVGRGTDQPFEWIGAPWLDGRALAAALAKHRLSGVRFVPTIRTPASSTHANKPCDGIQIIVDDWASFEPLQTGLTIAVELRRLFPMAWEVDRYGRLLGHKATLDALKSGESVDAIAKSWQADLNSFAAVRAKYLLYPD